jgi:queuine/archaeosine tRNA-ribosyltransferase
MNWNEYRFWRKTRNRFLWPTQFSLFGLFNIQRLGEQVLLSNDEIRNRLETETWDAQEDGHCFYNRDNYTVTEDGKLRLLDYGSEGSQNVVTKHGEVFANISGLP